MDKKIDKIIKFNIILGVLEFIVLTFTILSGLEFGFKKWNWITIIVCVSVYIIMIIAAIIYDNIGKTKGKRMINKRRQHHSSHTNPKGLGVLLSSVF